MMIIICRGSQGITVKCLMRAWPPSTASPYLHVSLNPSAVTRHKQVLKPYWLACGQMLCRGPADLALPALIPWRLKVSAGATVSVLSSSYPTCKNFHPPSTQSSIIPTWTAAAGSGHSAVCAWRSRGLTHRTENKWVSHRMYFVEYYSLCNYNLHFTNSSLSISFMIRTFNGSESFGDKKADI